MPLVRSSSRTKGYITFVLVLNPASLESASFWDQKSNLRTSTPDVYCLDADGSLFDAALLSAVAAFSHLHIPAVSVNDDGRVVAVSEEEVESNLVKEPFNQSTRKLKLSCMPFSLTCILHKKHILADPTGEEESVMESFVTVVLDLSGQLVSFNKPGGPVLAYTSAVQDCIALTRQRVKELQNILNDAIADMELD